MKTMLSMKQLVILNKPISSSSHLIITRGLARTIWPLTSYAGPTPRPGGWWPNGPACAASLSHKRFLIWQYKCIRNNVLCGSFFAWRRLWSIFLVILECLDSFFLFQTEGPPLAQQDGIMTALYTLSLTSILMLLLRQIPVEILFISL